MVERVRYSWVKNLILAILLNGGVMHGYAMYKRVEEIVGTKWRPSIGTFYRFLSELRNEGLINCSKQGRKTTCSITDKGVEYLSSNVLEHLPKFVGVLNEVLTAYIHIANFKGASPDQYVRERILKLVATANALLNLGSGR